MGTKSKRKAQPADEADLKTEKKKKLWFLKVFRKRKYKSLSEENLHADEIDVHLELEGESSAVPPKRDTPDDTVDWKMSENETNGVQEDNHERPDGKNVPKEKKTMMDSAINFFKHPFKSRKRRKHNYSQFAESTEDLVEAKDSNVKDSDNRTNIEKTTESKTKSDKLNKEKASTSGKYVHFEETEIRGTESAGVEDAVEADHDEPTTSQTPKKKKKSTKKRVIKAGRSTCKMFGRGMLQTGKNLQYLSPIPSPHVFADSASKATRAREPKKKTYKYTASAPPPNVYSFI